jgi:hypothetical protein
MDTENILEHGCSPRAYTKQELCQTQGSSNNVHRRTVWPVGSARRTPRAAGHAYARQRIAAGGRRNGKGSTSSSEPLVLHQRGTTYLPELDYLPPPDRRRVHGTLLAC